MPHDFLLGILQQMLFQVQNECKSTYVIDTQHSKNIGENKITGFYDNAIETNCICSLYHRINEII